MSGCSSLWGGLAPFDDVWRAGPVAEGTSRGVRAVGVVLTAGDGLVSRTGLAEESLRAKEGCLALEGAVRGDDLVGVADGLDLELPVGAEPGLDEDAGDAFGEETVWVREAGVFAGVVLAESSLSLGDFVNPPNVVFFGVVSSTDAAGSFAAWSLTDPSSRSSPTASCLTASTMSLPFSLISSTALVLLLPA